MAVRIQQQDFDAGRESRALVGADTGATAMFVGTVRGGGDGELTAMTLEHYPGMTEDQLAKIEADALMRWKLDGVVIIHRVGRLLPGDNIVLVAATSRHRQDALDAVGFIMDYLKTDAPFWKCEERGGESHWVDSRESDGAARKRWD